MQGQIIHPIPFILVQTIGLLLLLVIMGRRTDLQWVDHPCGTAHGVNPVPVQIKAQVPVFGFRVYYQDFCALHKLG